MNIISKIKKYICDNRLLSQGDVVIVGVSGGADSVALLHILHSLQYEFGLQLYVAHFNHQLRRGSNTDEKFVKKLAQQLHLPCITESWAQGSSQSKGSLEELAREARIQFFMKMAKSHKANIIALAHNKNDLAETVLMRIVRGTGLQGMRSILPKRLIQKCNFIRPLLETPREEIENYLHKHKQSWRNDPSNQQTKFFRNRIRLELLPLLTKDYNQNITDILSNLSKNISVDYDFLEQKGCELFKKMAIIDKNKKNIKFSLQKYTTHHPALKRLLIRQTFQYLKGNTKRFTFSHYEEIEDLIENRPNGSVVDLPQGIQSKKYNKYINFYQK